MKLNISYPVTGMQKAVEIEDETKLRALYDKRISHEVSGEDLDASWSGYIFKITGGNDKQGFPMKQGVLTPYRVRLLLGEGASCYRARRKGTRKRKSVRGCVVSSDLSALHLVVVRRGPSEIEGLTDSSVPRRLGPKRASKIRKLFHLEKEDDVRQFVVKRTFEKNGRTITKSPKIQRLVTPQRLQHRRQWRKELRTRIEKSRSTAEEYNELVALRAREEKARKAERKASRKTSQASN